MDSRVKTDGLTQVDEQTFRSRNGMVPATVCKIGNQQETYAKTLQYFSDVTGYFSGYILYIFYPIYILPEIKKISYRETIF